MRFADGYEFHIASITASSQASLFDSSPDLGKINLDVAVHTLKYIKSGGLS